MCWQRWVKLLPRDRWKIFLITMSTLLRRRCAGAGSVALADRKIKAGLTGEACCPVSLLVAALIGVLDELVPSAWHHVER